MPPVKILANRHPARCLYRRPTSYIQCGFAPRDADEPSPHRTFDGGLTGLFVAVGYLIGGETGMVIAFLFAAATNFFAYWNSDQVVLRMYGAQEVDERSAPDLVHLVRQLAENAGLPMPRGLYRRQSPAQRLRHRAQSRTRRGLRDQRHSARLSTARNWRACWPMSSPM